MNPLYPDVDQLMDAYNAMEEWVVIVDARAHIVFMNRPYARFLGYQPAQVLGRPVKDIIENTRMPNVLASGQAERADLQEIRGNRMIANRYPIVRDGQVVGAVGTVLFHDTQEWKQINSHIRALIAERDYYPRDQEPASGSGAHFQLNDVVGNSPAILALNSQVKKLAAGDVSVLIRGESGTGKELYAHAIHLLSDRADRPFIKVNCAAIPDTLLEAELFGYEHGAFTGARKGGKPGKFQLAHGGTLFLDEVGDMPLVMQAKLLRVLQDRQVEAIGATQSEPVDIRLITATHKPLETLIENNTFREDLYYRINVVSLTLPALRERPDDIPLLVEHFLARLSRRTGRRAPGFDDEAHGRLMAYRWPGNIRELENVLESTFYMSRGDELTCADLPDYIAGESLETPRRQGSLKDQLADAERTILENALRICRNNRARTARYLGVSKSTLYEKLARHDLI